MIREFIPIPSRSSPVLKIPKRMETYKLMYSDIYLGKITEKDYDFPNISGVVELSTLNLEDPTQKIINDYIQYSIEVNELILNDQEDEIDYDKQVPFLDLINSDNWHLILPNGTKENILTPNFFMDSGIVWRWNI